MRFWTRPLHAMTGAFTAAGFRITVISEPYPVEAARELFPDEYRALTTNPSFLFFILTAPRQRQPAERAEPTVEVGPARAGKLIQSRT